MSQYVNPPLNFSWVVQEKLAAMAWPQTEANIEYVVESGIKHLVTLSPEKIPPAKHHPKVKWKLISIQEFQAPTLDQIRQFIDICEEAERNKEAVGVHCRQGRGRTGVMAACYLVGFHGLSPDRAITNLRLARPGSIETYMQEKAVSAYYDFLQRSEF
ncbi:dual specificity protein phosphatase 23-like isoform X2 [Macrosteles quadrilineatus]|nr:dual specificity protein phosphatase 23-like isoform X2 [Macrosteles quadrilineatus]XP_054257982.1 dual specificity protein phosphatase 23-like isoform X2 [Macrosteles quadrilineatus]XP_054257983.1 dual specificity protein phosphatase 23-like isoform X2 [Macrosteles quadrilineatus]